MSCRSLSARVEFPRYRLLNPRSGEDLIEARRLSKQALSFQRQLAERTRSRAKHTELMLLESIFLSLNWCPRPESNRYGCYQPRDFKREDGSCTGHLSTWIQLAAAGFRSAHRLG